MGNAESLAGGAKPFRLGDRDEGRHPIQLV
jgi:hypothetical protein